MSETDKMKATITIDTKRNCIRVFKSTLHRMNNPQYIQLLFNPEENAVAIRCLDELVNGDCAERVDMNKLRGSSYELYSLSLIRQIQAVANLESEHSYRLSGTAIISERIAVFPINTLQLIENTSGGLKYEK